MCRFVTYDEKGRLLLYNLFQVMTMNRIKELRTESGMKQTELAAMLSVGRTAISTYETEARQLDPPTIRLLCQIFDCSSDYLLGLSTQRRPELSDADAELLAAYRRAPISVRTGIDALLQPYREENKKTAAG